METVSKTIIQGKEEKQTARFEISDPNRPIISMKALLLREKRSIFVQVRLCCFRQPRLSW